MNGQLSLHDAMAFARTAPAWPVTLTDVPHGRDIEWARPADCSDWQAAHMERRLREHDWFDEQEFPVGEYLAVPTLWGVELTHVDGSLLGAAA